MSFLGLQKTCQAFTDLGLVFLDSGRSVFIFEKKAIDLVLNRELNENAKNFLIFYPQLFSVYEEKSEAEKISKECFSLKWE